MAVNVSRFQTWKPQDVILPSGKSYPCRQLTAGGRVLLQRIYAAARGEADDDVDVMELAEEVEFLTGAPHAEVMRCSIEEMIGILVGANKAATDLAKAIVGDAEKNGDSGAVSPAPRSKRKK